MVQNHLVLWSKVLLFSCLYIIRQNYSPLVLWSKNHLVLWSKVLLFSCLYIIRQNYSPLVLWSKTI